jgi:hypothetical protein
LILRSRKHFRACKGAGRALQNHNEESRRDSTLALSLLNSEALASRKARANRQLEPDGRSQGVTTLNRARLLLNKSKNSRNVPRRLQHASRRLGTRARLRFAQAESARASSSRRETGVSVATGVALVVGYSVLNGQRRLAGPATSCNFHNFGVRSFGRLITRASARDVSSRCASSQLRTRSCEP